MASPVHLTLTLLVALVALCTGCAARSNSGSSAGASYPSYLDRSGTSGSTSAGLIEYGKASYYADSLAGRPTASGQPYLPTEMTAAHRTLPFGTVLEVVRVDGRKVVVRVNDRGPFVKGRIVDLSRSAAEALGMVREGVVDVRIRAVSTPKPRATSRSRE